MTISTDQIGVPVVRACGTPAEIGLAYGEQARGAIVANVERYEQRTRGLGGLDGADVARLGERFRGATRERQPRIAAMLDGVAAGAGCAPSAIYALNARTELLNAAAADGGCTVLGLDATRTEGGRVLLAQNWDWSPDLADGMLVLATEDERGHAVVTLTEAGMLAKSGLNSAGVGACVNILATDRDGARGGEGALPYHVILRAVLESGSFAEALLAAAGTPRAASLNVLIGAASGELVDLELVPGDVAWTWPTAGWLAHANHLEACASASDRILLVPAAAASSQGRSARAGSLLATATRRAAGATAHDLTGALRDHGDHPICVHADTTLAPQHRTATLASVLLDLGARRFAIAAGPPCAHEHVPLTLGELFP